MFLRKTGGSVPQNGGKKYLESCRENNRGLCLDENDSAYGFLWFDMNTIVLWFDMNTSNTNIPELLRYA